MEEIDRKLFMAAGTGQVDELILLLRLGANAKVANMRRATPLMIATLGGHVSCVNALLPLSDPLAIDEEGCSALIYASQHHRLDCAKALIDVSDVDRKDYEGLSALDHARLRSDGALLGFMQSYKQARLEAAELAIATPHGSDEPISANRL